MNQRTVALVMTPTEAHEAKGVNINRTIGSEKMVLLDPFLLLDHLTLANDGTAPGEIGFPRHPHRGIQTLTYVLQGRVGHRDSRGNDEIVGAGEAQFMTAGAGIFHEEMVSADGNGNHQMIQLWINLPANGKMVPPTYQAAHNDEIPIVTTAEGAAVRVIAGVFDGKTGPLTGIVSDPTYLDVSLPAGASVTLPAPTGTTALAYVVDGNPRFGAAMVQAVTPNLVVFSEQGGDTATVHAGDTNARVIFVCARPYGEPVMQYRSLVMTTVQQIKEALDDLQNNTFDTAG